MRNAGFINFNTNTASDFYLFLIFAGFFSGQFVLFLRKMEFKRKGRDAATTRLLRRLRVAALVAIFSRQQLTWTKSSSTRHM